MLREEVVSVENPYQAPASADEPAVVPVAGLKNSRVLALASLWLYAISIASDVAASVLRTFVDTSFVGSDLHDSHDVAQPGILDGLMVVGGLASPFVYLLWKYRVARNAILLEPACMTVSPAMAVRSYFIPFLNFVLPCKAMAGISRATLGHSRGVVLWWTCHLGTLLIAIALVITDRMETSGLSTSLSEFLRLVWDVTTFLVSWWLVMRITRGQCERGAG